MLIKNLTKREKIGAAGYALFIFLIATYQFVVKPVSGTWQRLHNERQAKTLSLKRDLRMLASRKQLEESQKKMSKYLYSEKSEGEAVAELMEIIESVSRNNSCLIINIKPVGSKMFGKGYQEVLVDVSLEGSAQCFLKFLFDIETNEKMILNVRRFTLSSKSGQKDVLRGFFLIGMVAVK